MTAETGFLTPHQYFKLQGLGPRKRFGQHFLARLETAERIVESAHLEGSDVVVEVGPGIGALTRYIIPKVRRLHLVELDRDLARYLGEVGIASECEVSVHEQDILDFDFERICELEGQKLVLVGNLPYNISSPLLFRILESRSGIDRCVFMVQRELGERLSAKPGTKAYGVLSVLLGYYAVISRLFSVGPGQFVPPPKVDSMVLSIEFRHEAPSNAPSFSFLRRVVNAAFQQRRKTLQNSLKSVFGQNPAELAQAFADNGINPLRRPETLNPLEFSQLARSLEV